MVERLTVNQVVVGSSPTPGVSLKCLYRGIVLMFLGILSPIGLEHYTTAVF